MKAITRNHGDTSYTITLQDGGVVDADDIVLTCPAKVAATLVDDLAKPAASLLAGIRYVSTGAIALYLIHSCEPTRPY